MLDEGGRVVIRFFALGLASGSVAGPMGGGLRGYQRCAISHKICIAAVRQTVRLGHRSNRHEITREVRLPTAAEPWMQEQQQQQHDIHLS